MNSKMTGGKAEKTLYVAVLALTEFYLLVAVFRHFEPDYDRLFAMVQWVTLLLIPAALLFCSLL